LTNLIKEQYMKWEGPVRFLFLFLMGRFSSTFRVSEIRSKIFETREIFRCDTRSKEISKADYSKSYPVFSTRDISLLLMFRLKYLNILGHKGWEILIKFWFCYALVGWVIRKLRAKTNFRNLSLTLLIPGVYHII